MTSPTGARSLKATFTLKKLRGQLLRTDTSKDDEKYNIWAELMQCLNKRSIIMLRLECRGNRPEAWKQLTAHFSSSETPRLMKLLSMTPTKDMTDYLITAESLSSLLEVAGEMISEKLLVSVVLKGSPDNYDSFKTVHDFSKTLTPFSDLKKILKNFAENKRLR